MICFATGIAVSMMWPKASKANARWAFYLCFYYHHENIMLGWVWGPLAWSPRRRMRHTQSGATTTDLQTHELNKCYRLMPQWFCSVWIHRIIVTIANWYNHLLSICHPSNCFTFLNPSFLISKRKLYFVTCWEDQSWCIVFCTYKCLKMTIFMLLLSLHKLLNISFLIYK